MQPVLGKKLDKIRLGIHEKEPSPTESIFSDHTPFSQAEIDAAFRAPSAASVDGIPPTRVVQALNQTQAEIKRLEIDELAAYKTAQENGEYLKFLKETYTRVTEAGQYIRTFHHKVSQKRKRAKIRRTVAHRLRELHYQRLKLLDALHESQAKNELTLARMLQVERALQVECQYANVDTIEEIMGTAAALWDEMNEVKSPRRNVLPEANGQSSRGPHQQQWRQQHPPQQRQQQAAQYETPQRNTQQWRGRESQMVTPQGRPNPNMPTMQSDASGRLIAYIPHGNTPQQSDFQHPANLSQWDVFF